MNLMLRLGRAADYLRVADVRGLSRQAGRLIYSDSVGIGIRKDLIADTVTPALATAQAVRRASFHDVEALVSDKRTEDATADEHWQRRLRRYVVSSMGIDNCYVADEPGVGPCFMQYLFFHADNDLIQSVFPQLYPVLSPDEAMVEFLYVAPEARRAGFATECMSQVADEARRGGASSVISFVRPNSKGAIKVCERVGFRFDSVRRLRYRFFRQTITHEPRPEGMSQFLSDQLTNPIG